METSSALGHSFFNVFPHHFGDRLLVDFQIVFVSCLVLFLCFVWICSSIVLKLVDLCKYALRLHGTMFFEVLTLRFLIVVSWFVYYSHHMFRLIGVSILGMHFGSPLDRYFKFQDARTSPPCLVLQTHHPKPQTWPAAQPRNSEACCIEKRGVKGKVDGPSAGPLNAESPKGKKGDEK